MHIGLTIWGTHPEKKSCIRKYRYRILPIKRTVRIEVGNFFWSRGIDDLPFNRTPQWLPIGEHWSLLRLCALAVQLASDICCYNRTREIVNWSKLWPCGEYEQWEREGTAEIAEFSAGLQTRQEERYVILLFLLLLGGSFTSFSWHLRWSFTL